MNLINRGIRFLAEKRGLQVIPSDSYVPPTFASTSAGISVNHTTALKFSAVFSAIRIYSENIASLPKSVIKQTAGKKEVLSSHPVAKLISRRANSMHNAFDFWEYINPILEGHGHTIGIIERDKYGDPVAIWPIHKNNFLISKVNNRLYYKVYGTDWDGTYSDFEVVDFKLFSTDGIHGIDPITYFRQTIGVGLASESFNAEFFSKGGHIKGVYETEQGLEDEQYNKIVAHLASAKNYETPLLEYGIKYKQITISPEAAQMIQQRTFTIQDIARIFVIPPSLLAEHSRSTFSNNEQQDIQFVKYGIRPRCKRFEMELENKLLYDGESEEIDIKFNLDGLLRGDTATRSAFYHNGILDGWLNRREVRELENMDSGPEELNEFIYPSNMNFADILMQSQANNGNSNNNNNQNSQSNE